MFREGTEVLESRNGWARISKLYSASCEDGKSKYVEKGNSKCTEANGITGGQLAEWVQESGLSTTRPADPADSASSDETLVAQSDDFKQHHAAFAKAAKDLIASGRCTEADFKEQGGWLSDPDETKGPVYFIHCGGFTVADTVYLNAATGRTY
jgi:hypothetical protein